MNVYALTISTGPLYVVRYEKWSPRGRFWPRRRPRRHILKSLTSKLKSLALAQKPVQVLEMPCLWSRTAFFSDWLKRNITKQKTT